MEPQAPPLLTILDERNADKCRIKAKAKAKGKDKEKADVQNNTPKKRCLHKQSTPETDMQKRKAGDISASSHACVPVKRPSVSTERSRGPPHFMCRSGVGGPGSTFKIAWGPGQKHTSEKAARAAADNWVRAECKRRGIE